MKATYIIFGVLVLLISSTITEEISKVESQKKETATHLKIKDAIHEGFGKAKGKGSGNSGTSGGRGTKSTGQFGKAKGKGSGNSGTSRRRGSGNSGGFGSAHLSDNRNIHEGFGRAKGRGSGNNRRNERRGRKSRGGFGKAKGRGSGNSRRNGRRGRGNNARFGSAHLFDNELNFEKDQNSIFKCLNSWNKAINVFSHITLGNFLAVNLISTMISQTTDIGLDCIDFNQYLSTATENCKLQVKAFQSDISEIPWLLTAMNFERIRNIMQISDQRLNTIREECNPVEENIPQNLNNIPDYENYDVPEPVEDQKLFNNQSNYQNNQQESNVLY